MNRKRLIAWLSTLLMLTAAAVPVSAQGGVQNLDPLSPAPGLHTFEMIDETPVGWFVELSGSPVADNGNRNNLKRERDNFRAAAARAGVNLQERFEFDTLFNGFSIQATPDEVSKLARISGVKAIWPVVTVEMPETIAGPSEPDIMNAINMTGASYVQSELGFTGRGIKVAIMDTGVDYHHPDLGGCFGPGCRVAYGWDFVGDAFNANPTSPGYNPIPSPGPDPDDCNGHGTHVAGIVGARGETTGVAPDVTFGSYRVFGCEGSTTADIMIAAMERALADGMHVLNMSIGSAFQWPEYPTAKAATRLVNRGMVVVASIGNSGTNGLYAAGAPGVGEKVIGVAAFQNSHISQRSFRISPDGAQVGYASATAAPLAPTSGSYDLARTGTQTTDNDGCAPLPAGSLEGKVALIRRGTCGFYDKALNAQNAGAVGVVLYNNQPGSVNPTVAGDVPITIPVVMASQVQGNMIHSRLAEGPVTLTWTDEMFGAPNPTGGLIADFSSYGLAPDLSLKPDIGAPGGSIYATYPLERGGYATLSGTSMSAPHVAGAVALLLEAKPRTPAQAVRSILQNTAVPQNWWGNPGLGYLDMVHRQGAGMIQIDKAILATTKVEPGKLSLGDSKNGPVTQSLTIENNSKSAVTYDLSHTPALSSSPNAYTVGAQTGFASVAFNSASVTVPAGGKATVSVTIAANPALAERALYGGYIVITPQGGGDTIRVPYAGMKGDYQSMPILTPSSYDFPWLASLSGGSYFRATDGQVFTMVDGDIPYFIAHFDHHARQLRITVREADSGRNWHDAVNTQYLAKNSTPTGFFAFAFDGTTVQGNGNRTHVVPDGDYVLEVSVLKPLGDEGNPAHWETWTSPVFTVQRP